MAARRKEPVLGREIPSETTMGRAVPTRPRRGRNTPSQKERVIAAIERDHVELWGDGETTAAVINRSGIPTRQVLQGSFLDDSVKPLVDAMVTWTTSVGGGGGSGRDRKGSLFERDLFVVNDSFFEQLAAAYNAADDDIVGAYLSSSEALAFGNIKIECDEDDEANIWDQICDDIDLSSRMREIWRELAITGQAYVASWFGKKPYQVQGKSEAGVKRKKTFANLTVPLGLTVLDPFRVVAVGNFLFNKETLCVEEGSLVYMPTGPKPIETLQPGDHVWSYENGCLRECPVKAVAATGVRQIWEINTGHTTLRVTPNHPVLILERNGTPHTRKDLHTCWVRADEVRAGDFLVGTRRLPEIVHGPFPTLELARLAGIWVGDGTVSHCQLADGSPKAYFELTSNVAQTDNWSDLVMSIGAVAHVLPHRLTPNAQVIHFTSYDLLPWLEEVRHLRSSERFVPSWVWRAPRKVQLAFLGGYLEADGTREWRREEFKVACSSASLAKELRSLCHYIGYGTSNLRSQERPGTAFARGGTYFVFTAYPNPGRQVPTTYSWHNSEQPVRFLDGDMQARRVRSSKLTGDQRSVYDIEVEDAHNFIVDAQVVHNCYIADPTEKDVIDSWLLGDDSSGADPIIQRLVVAKYEPDYRDRKELVNIGGGGFSIDPNRLYVLNPKYVWRHTLTRPGYSRFAPVPMRRCFELLDLKRQLKAADRAALIGVAQFIVLITKGTDHHPASQYEINYLQGQAATMGSSPVLVGDHRLKVEIITPKTEHILDESRYGVLNLGIQGTLYGMFMTTHAGRDDSLKLARVVARGLESRRDMQKMAIMKNIFYPVYEFNDSLTCIPRMVFHPKRIALDFDPSLATYLLDLFDRNGISRESILAEVDYDEREEAMKRKTEKEKWDQYFTPPIDPLFDPAIAPTSVTAKVGTAGAPAPANSTAPKPGAPKPGSPNDPKRAGRAGGGNHGQAGNGGKPRGAGLPARRGVPADQHSGTYTPPGSAGVKGIRSRPKLEKHGQVSDALEEMQGEIDSTDLTDED